MVNKKNKKIIIDKQNFNNIQMFNEDIEKYSSIRETILNFKNTFLFKGDVLNTKIFRKNFCDLIITSPPYNIGKEYETSQTMMC